MTSPSDVFLLVDTSDRIALIGVYRAEQPLWESRACAGRPTLKWIGDSVEESRKATGVNLSGLRFVACGVGPGGFTSVRLGISVVKAISQARGLPVVGVNRLEAAVMGEVALRPPVFPARYCVRLAAAKDIDYFAVYRVDEGALPVCEREPAALPPGRIARMRLAKSVMSVQISPDVFYAGVPKAAWLKWRAGAAAPFSRIAPLYLRTATLGPATSKVDVARRKIVR